MGIINVTKQALRVMIEVEGIEEAIVIDANKLDQRVIDAAIVHGLTQKIIDAAALSRNPDTGRAATPEDKFNAMRAVADRLQAGEWNATKGGGVVGGFLYRALKFLRPDSAHLATPEAFGEWLDAQAKSRGVTRRALEATLRAREDVAAAITSFRAKGDYVDTDSMIDGL